VTAISHAPETDGSRGQGKTTSGRRRGRRRGLEIRPGSVKQARQQAGMSLGQVARDDISRTAIYFVETGKARPSMETLQLIADRTGQPLDFFLATGDGYFHPEAKIVELERLMSTGDNAGVVAVAEGALAQKSDAETQARIRLIASLAYLRLAQPVVGRRLAQAARAHFEQAGDLARVAECLGLEAQAAGLLQEPGAVAIAEGALTTCRSLNPVPQVLEARLLRVLGHQLVAAQDWQRAIACYEEAVASSDVVQDLHQLSLVYSGLSLAHQEMGQIGEASRYAQKALTIHETLNDRLSQARSLNNLGWMLLHLGELVSARRHLTHSLDIFEEQRVETGKAETLMSIASLEFAEGDLEAASRTSRQALELATRLGEAATAAEAHTRLGLIAARQGHDELADAAFSSAIAAAEATAGGRRLAQVHEAYAEVFEARGDLVTANRHLREALAASRPIEREARIATA